MTISLRDRPLLLEYAGSCASSTNEWHLCHLAIEINKISCLELFDCFHIFKSFSI